jgi:hypothetical protein
VTHEELTDHVCRSIDVVGILSLHLAAGAEPREFALLGVADVAGERWSADLLPHREATARIAALEAQPFGRACRPALEAATARRFREAASVFVTPIVTVLVDEETGHADVKWTDWIAPQSARGDA